MNFLKAWLEKKKMKLTLLNCFPFYPSQKRCSSIVSFNEGLQKNSEKYMGVRCDKRLSGDTILKQRGKVTTTIKQF